LWLEISVLNIYQLLLFINDYKVFEIQSVTIAQRNGNLQSCKRSFSFDTAREYRYSMLIHFNLHPNLTLFSSNFAAYQFCWQHLFERVVGF
jgi:hypothetical protein